MENKGSVQQTDNERRCQVEGCTDVTVGARTSLCRKHRNNKYKQNYKKKKRKAQGVEDNPGESLESQLAVEKYHLEQKYASMLQQVLVQKRLELLQSPSICNLLRIHQQNVRQGKQIEITEKRKAAQNQCNSKIQQERHSKSHSISESSLSCSSAICSSAAATTKPNSTSSKAGSSNKTFTKSSKQSSRPTQGRNTSKNSKNRNNINSSVDSSVNGLGSHIKSTSNCNESAGRPVYVSSGAWVPVEEKREFCDIRQLQNFQLQQVASQKMLHHTKQQSLQQQKQQHQQQHQHQQQQQPLRNMQVQQPEVLLQHCQQRSISKQQLQHLQHQKLLEQLHQKQLHEQQENEQQQFRHQQQKREQLVQQHHQQHLLHQRRLQQQRQHELHIQLQNNRQQQKQPQQHQQQVKQQQVKQQQLQQHQQLQQRQVTVHQNQHQVQFQQQQQQQQNQHPQNSSVAQAVKNVSGTELLSQTLPSIQSSLSTLLVSQSNINTTSSHDVISTAGTRPSVLPRTILCSAQGRTQNANSINHMVSNAPSVSSHRPIAPRLEGHPSVNNTLCNGGMPIITAIMSAPQTQQIILQNASNGERDSLHVGAESNTLTSINSFGNTFNNHYPLMPFNVQMDKWI